jgi:hypothetical protein
MFEDLLIDDWFEDGWLLLAFVFLINAYDFLIKGTRHPQLKLSVQIGNIIATAWSNVTIFVVPIVCSQSHLTSWLLCYVIL